MLVTQCNQEKAKSNRNRNIVAGTMLPDQTYVGSSNTSSDKNKENEI